MTKDHVTVALSGDGGDELFAGYTRYAIQQRRDTATAIPTALREGIIRRASRFLPHGAPGKNFLYNVSLDPIGRYIDSVSHFNGPRRNMLYSAAMREKLNGEMEAGEELFRSIAASSGTADPLGTLLYLDGRTYLPGDILTKVDRMSMAASLETRSPLLDHELIEFTAAIPSALKLNGGRTKYIFKKAMEGIVPNEILYREKQGFGVPIGRWINHQLNERVREDLTGPRAIERGYFDQAYVKRLLAEHGSGRRDHAYSIWVLWMLELWHRKFVDGGAAG
jgi:asparagine synthase (glutamine-hydrolysing)